jgi:predicted enzyme related to lactoylglutathione lyase
MHNPVGWFEIYIEDLARAKTFYEAVLGVQVSKLDGPGMDLLAFAMQGQAMGASGALVRMPAFASGANSVIV